MSKNNAFLRLLDPGIIEDYVYQMPWFFDWRCDCSSLYYYDYGDYLTMYTYLACHFCDKRHRVRFDFSFHAQFFIFSPDQMFPLFFNDSGDYIEYIQSWMI